MDFIDFSVCSYNCCSMRKNIDLIREITEIKYDVLFLQETFITDQKMNIFDYVDENYECVSVPATLSDKALVAMAGRPEGGMAILWRKNINFKINKIVLEKNFMAFNIRILDSDILLINTYLNSDLWEARTLDMYLETLSTLEDVIQDFNFDAVFLIGDFNADPLSGRAWRSLSTFMNDNSFSCFDVSMLPLDSFTFIGYGNSVSRWLDHIVGREDSMVKVKKVAVLNDIIGSDHFPLEIMFEINTRNNSSIHPVVICTDSNNKIINDGVKWNSLLDTELRQIDELACQQLGKLNDLLLQDCSITGCRNRDHLHKIDLYYNKICAEVSTASQVFKTKFVKSNKYKVIPGWNRRVKHQHVIARSCFLKWVECGRKRGTREYEEMVQSRRNFKNSLKICRQNEHKEICQSIVLRFSKKDKTKFWKEVKNKRGKEKITNIIDGESDEGEIANIFTNKFLGNPVHNENMREMRFIDEFKSKWADSMKMHLRISSVSIRRALIRLNNGSGHDGIHSTFLKNASDDFLNILSVFYNACFCHCYIPTNMLKGNIFPTVKDKKNNITESSNYRPVMQSSCLLKLYEIHLLEVLSEKVSIDKRQFGFKKGVSTSDTCFLLKELMHNYCKNKVGGIMAFVDLSKAFDNVDHFILGTKLLNRGVPVDIIYMIMHYLRNQYANVIWRDHHGCFYPVEKGVRQGGILSPFLFKLYIDSIITEISEMDQGCRLGITRLNVLAYADDIVLIAKSREQLEKLFMKLCIELGNHGLTMNKMKTKCMTCSIKNNKDNVNIIKLGTDNFDVVNSYKYLGHLIRSDLQDTNDIEMHLKKFYASFNGILRDFKHVDKETLLFLFNSYCKPDYGLCLWNNQNLFKGKIFKTFEVAFSNALRRIIGAPSYSSSHEAAETSGQLLLKHHLALVQARYYKRLTWSNSSIIKFYLPLLQHGYFCTHVQKLFQRSYNISICNNDLNIIRSRLLWVQRHEARRTPVVLPQAP